MSLCALLAWLERVPTEALPTDEEAKSLGLCGFDRLAIADYRLIRHVNDEIAVIQNQISAMQNAIDKALDEVI